MYSLSLIISFLSIWCLFATSPKVEFVKKHLTLALSQKKTLARGLSLGLLFIATLLLSLHLGIVTGVLTELCIWLLLASIIVLFAPFQKLNRLQLILIGVVVISIELSLIFIF